MKTALPIPHRARASERGFAVFFLFVLLSIMLLLVAANTRTLFWLRQEVSLVEKRQLERLALTANHQPPAAVTITNSPPAP